MTFSLIPETATLTRTFVAIALLSVGSPACSDSEDGETAGLLSITQPTQEPVVVRVTPAALTLEVDQSGQFTADVFGGNWNDGRGVTWSTFATNVVSLAQSGAVTCRTAGTAQITAAAIAAPSATASSVVICTAPPPPPRRSFVILSPEVIAFQIITACSQRVVGVINIRNVFAEAIGLGFRSDHRAVTPFVAESSLQPGADGRLSIVHDCSGERVDGIITVTATAADGTTDVQRVRVEGR